MTYFIYFLGVALRLGMWLVPKSPWSDEWFSMALALRQFPEVFWGAIQDVHPPLYFLLLHVLASFFGDALWVFRLPSFLASLSLLPALYLAAKETAGQKAALTALYLAAISPYWLQSANEIRSYSLLSFVTCLSAFFLVRSASRPHESKWRWAYLGTAVLSVTLEHVAWFWLAAATAYLVNLFFKERRGSAAARFHRWALFLAAPSLALTAYQALYKESFFNFERIREYLPPLILLKKAAGIFWHFSCGYFYSMLTMDALAFHLETSPFFWLSAVTALSALFFAVKGFRTLWKSRRPEAVLFAAVLVLPFATLGIFYAIRLDARYLSFAAPFYFILLGAGASAAGFRARAAFLALFTAVNLFGAFQAVASPADAVHREDYKNMVAHVLDHAATSDAVIGKRLAADYYQRTLGRRFAGVYFQEPHDFFMKGRVDFERVWMMDSVNMHPEVTDRQFETTRLKMEALGYRLTGPPIVFGGTDALTRLYIFERTKTSHE